MKKNVIIWANCQGGPIHFMLNKYYSDKFNIYRFLNYEYIRNKNLIPEEFNKCDIFIYQNYSDKPGSIYDLSYILNEVLKKECIKISFPFLTFHTIFCYDSSNPENKKTINQDYPHGKFFFGISIIRKYMENVDVQSITNKEVFINNIVDKFMNEEISEETIKSYYDFSFSYLENKLLNSDVPNILNFIKDNFTKIRLFHNMNHPTGVLLNEVVKEIFKLLNLQYDYNNENENENIRNLNNLNFELALEHHKLELKHILSLFHNTYYQDDESNFVRRRHHA